MNAMIERPAEARLEGPRPVGFVADFACPWCYLGLARLIAAGGRPIWRPFLLNPHLPPSGMPRARYLARKFGDPRAAERIHDRIASLGAAEGLVFRFDRMAVTPNSAIAHAATLAVQDEAPDRALALIERLFRAVFAEGIDIGSPAALARLIEEAGAPLDLARAAMVSRELQRRIRDAHHAASTAGVSGVPTFVFDDSAAIAGAQPREVLSVMIEDARAASAPRLETAGQSGGGMSGDQAW